MWTYHFSMPKAKGSEIFEFTKHGYRNCLELLWQIGWSEFKEYKTNSFILRFFWFTIALHLSTRWVPEKMHKFGLSWTNNSTDKPSIRNSYLLFHFTRLVLWEINFLQHFVNVAGIGVRINDKSSSCSTSASPTTQISLNLYLWMVHSSLLIYSPIKLIRSVPDIRHEWSVVFYEDSIIIRYGRQGNFTNGESKEALTIFDNVFLAQTFYREVKLDKHGERFEDESDEVTGSENSVSTSRPDLQKFTMVDEDGTVVTGTSYSSWLEYYRFGKQLNWLGKRLPRKRYHRVEVEFDSEVGPKKSSWKGGTRSISMLFKGKDLEESTVIAVRSCSNNFRSIEFID